jgi:hypothetical protein
VRRRASVVTTVFGSLSLQGCAHCPVDYPVDGTSREPRRPVLRWPADSIALVISMSTCAANLRGDLVGPFASWKICPNGDVYVTDGNCSLYDCLFPDFGNYRSYF